MTGGVPPFQYTWGGDGGLSASTQDASLLAPGTYWVYVEDAIGCMAVETYVVPLADPFTLSAVLTPSCNSTGGIDLTVTGGVGPFTYAWAPMGQTMEDIANVPSNFYMVTVTDAIGCEVTANWYLGALPMNLNTTTTMPACFGEQNGSIDLVVNFGAAPFTYAWSNGASTQDLNGLVHGTYSVIVTDANGCTTSGQFTIGQSSQMFLVPANIAASCPNEGQGLVDLGVVGGTAPYTFVWTGPGGFNATTKIPAISNVLPGDYTVVMTDALGCTLSQTYTVPGYPAIVIEAFTVPSCSGSPSGLIELDVAGGTPPMFFFWGGPGGFSATTEDIASLEPGTYQLMITDANNCNTYASWMIGEVTCCTASTFIPHGTLASVFGTAFSGTVDIQGQFIVDMDVTFYNAQVYMEPGAEIIVQNGWTLDIDNSSFTACNGIMWKSITAENGSTVRIWDAFLDDAESAIAALDGSVVWVDGTQFHNNRVGIGIPDVGGTYNNVACWVSNSTFYSAGPMPQPYPGQATAVGAQGFAAVDVHNTTFDFTGGNNIIHSMSNGIVAHRSDVNVSGCQMLNIHPDAAYTYMGNGAGIYANGSSSWSTLQQQGFGMNASPSFWDCRWGIYTEYMNVYSTDNHMVEMGTAYRIDRSGYRSVDILYNKMHTKFNGIDLRANDGAAGLLVQYNEVTFGDSPCSGCKAFTGIFVSEGNYANPSSRILNNTIHFLPLAASRFGIGLFVADQWLVAENTLLMADNALNFSGIQLSGCRRTEVSCNTVNGASATSFPVDGQAAIRNMMGSDPLISCNVVDMTANGILFNGVAYNTDVRGNFFHNHKWPLHLDATAIIDAQVLKGNLWDPNASAPVWGAWYEVSDVQSVVSAFLFDPATIGSGVTTPPSWSPPSWFVTFPGTNYDCGDHHGMDYCSQFNDERCKDCVSELDEKIASDSLENDPYTEETKLILGADLYKKLDNAPELLDSLPALEDFYNDLQGSTTAAFKAIEDDQITLYDLDSSVVAQLQANRAQIAGLIVLVKGGLEQLGDGTLTPAQRQAILTGITGYQQNIANLSDWNATAVQVASASKVLTADAVKAANAGIVTSELIEVNEKTVNDIYLATVGKDVDSFSSDQTSVLFDIASQCPMLGGNAVFKARSLYWLIDDDYYFDDASLCLPYGIIVKSLAEHPANNTAVIPNPAGDEATLVLARPLDEPGVFVVFDALGAEVLRSVVPVDMPRVTIVTGSLAPALYHYQVRGPSGVFGNGKLTIVR